MAETFAEIESCLKDGGDWCDLTRANAMASIIVGTRPEVVVEIGVWMGGSAIPMLLALRHLGAGSLVAIDPWEASASVEGQHGADAEWWGKVDHEQAYQHFCARLARHGVEQLCKIERKRSDAVTPPEQIGLLSIDGNHGPQAVQDVKRFAPSVPVGGWLLLDDVQWHGGNVTKALQLAWNMGFRTRYPLGTGVCLQRTREAPVFDFGGI